MDTEAILARRPGTCVVDEFPHTNVPGSPRGKRWEDVLLLREHGIHVLTTMNIQHLESLNDQVRQFTGIQVRETVPDWVVRQAEEVVLVDVTPRALLNRLERGVVYAPDKAQRAMENFFRESTLVALRELALRQVAHEVDRRQEDRGEPEFLAAPTAGDVPGPASITSDDPPERILIHVTAAPSTAALIRRGRRVADYLRADCFAVCVLPDSDLQSLPAAERDAFESHLNFARNLHIETRILTGADEAASLVEFARRHSVTQLFLARPPREGRPLLPGRDFLMRVVRSAGDMQVTIVANKRQGSAR